MIQQLSNQTLLLSDLGWLEQTRRFCSCPRNTEIWVCCLLCVYETRPLESLTKSEHLRVGNNVVTSETKNFNDLHRQFLDDDGLGDTKSVNLVENTRKQHIPQLPFVDLDELLRKWIHVVPCDRSTVANHHTSWITRKYCPKETFLMNPTESQFWDTFISKKKNSNFSWCSRSRSLAASCIRLKCLFQRFHLLKLQFSI